MLLTPSPHTSLFDHSLAAQDLAQIIPADLVEALVGMHQLQQQQQQMKATRSTDEGVPIGDTLKSAFEVLPAVDVGGDVPSPSAGAPLPDGPVASNASPSFLDGPLDSMVHKDVSFAVVLPSEQANLAARPVSDEDGGVVVDDPSADVFGDSSAADPPGATPRLGDSGGGGGGPFGKGWEWSLGPGPGAMIAGG